MFAGAVVNEIKPSYHILNSEKDVSTDRFR
jgi:hypothetical protein